MIETVPVCDNVRQASKVLKSLRQSADRIGFDMATGLHSTTSVDKANVKGNYVLFYAKL